MKQIVDVQEIKTISLDILQAVHDFCTDNDIKYSLACGTLIGAVRHNGFIPWDDDIDIYMVRSDYNRFVKCFPSNYHNRYSAISLENSKEWNRSYCKVYDNRTLIKEERKYNIGIGIGIDVFPIDNACDDDGKWKAYEKKRKILLYIQITKCFKWCSRRSTWKNVFGEMASLLLTPFSSRNIARCIKRYSQYFNEESTKYYAENCVGLPNNRFPKSDFSSAVMLPFENRYFYAMQGYDDYLTRFYGDYKQLPPLDKQISTHRYMAYWK